MNQYPHAISWFEIYVDDMDRAKTFYSAVLGITLADMDVPGGDDLKMSSFPSDPDPKKMSVGGTLVHMPGARIGAGKPGLSSLVYFPCIDCSVEAGRVAAAGGEVHKPKFSIGPFGFCAICEDTEGNMFGLHSME